MLRFYVLLVPLLRASCALTYAGRGDNVTLPCFSTAKYLSWYKQVAGEQPQMISNYYKYNSIPNMFYNQFKDDQRFSVHAGEGFYHLIISNVQDSDSAMYFCGNTTIIGTTFYKGALLVLKESMCRLVLQQPASDSVQPGSSTTLNCTVVNGSREGEDYVYWFRKDSQSSHIGVMYIHTHSSSSSKCVTSSGSPAQSCMYSLSKRNVSLSDAGTYYCAVASCGEILFGRGTTLTVGGKLEGRFLLYYVVASLVVSVIMNIILAAMLCKMAKHLCSEGSHPQLSTSEYTSDTQNEEVTTVQYAALEFKKRQSASSRPRRTEEDTIYSGVRQSEQQ
ncbi:uncharacterized protein LOC114451184 [Parambassis ranga]|uniref:Uncharacterized protein LOC114451184 n=1 Tax=Parambassis ranga TaxID=210632 RepID=A0A6P7K884_9TELE|nr:uncharacterized protein LOC114451184 [Parambassis ranga]